MLEIPALATAAVAALVPYLTEAGKEAAKKLGGAAAERLSGLLKSRHSPPAVQEALADVEKTPQDADAQASLRQALKKALTGDPAFRAELAALVAELPAGGVEQKNVQVGDGNLNVQVAGDSNQVGFGKPT